MSELTFDDLSPLAFDTRVYILQHLEAAVGPWTSTIGHDRERILRRRKWLLQLFSTKDLYGRFADDPTETLRLLFRSLIVIFERMEVRFLEIIAEVPFHRLVSLSVFLNDGMSTVRKSVKRSARNSVACDGNNDWLHFEMNLLIARGRRSRPRSRRSRRPREINPSCCSILSNAAVCVFPFRCMTALERLVVVVEDDTPVLDKEVISEIAGLRNLRALSFVFTKNADRHSLVLFLRLGGHTMMRFHGRDKSVVSSGMSSVSGGMLSALKDSPATLELYFPTASAVCERIPEADGARRLVIVNSIDRAEEATDPDLYESSIDVAAALMAFRDFSSHPDDEISLVSVRNEEFSTKLLARKCGTPWRKVEFVCSELHTKKLLRLVHNVPCEMLVLNRCLVEPWIPCPVKRGWTGFAKARSVIVMQEEGDNDPDAVVREMFVADDVEPAAEEEGGLKFVY